MTWKESVQTSDQDYTVLYCTVLCLPVLAAGAGREVDAAKDGDDELLPLPVVPGLHLQPAALQIMFWLRVLDIFRG